MDDLTTQRLPSDGGDPSATTAVAGEQSADAVSDAKVGLDPATLKRIEAAERRAASLEENLRKVQSAKDAEIAGVRKETKERLAKRERELLTLLGKAGVDAGELQAFSERRDREDEVDDLREKASHYDALTQQQAAAAQVQEYIDSLCEAADVDPKDARLDLSSKSAFEASLKRLKAERKKAGTAPTAPKDDEGEDDEPAKGKAKKAPSARDDLGVLDGGGGAGSGGDSDRELQDQLKKLRGTGRVAEAMRLMREHEAKKKKR